MDNKKNIRGQVLNIRNSLSEEEIKKRSKIIMGLLLDWEKFNQSQNVGFYVSKGKEVFTKNILNINKNIYLPFIGNHMEMNFSSYDGDLERGRFGVFEPAKKKIFEGKLDMMIIPGVVFDRNGARIGYGGGYYDKFLNNINTTKVGLAYNFQVKDEIPFEEHDEKMDFIITEEKIISCSKNEK